MSLPLWVCILVMCLSLAFGHCFKWPRRLPRLVAYSFGTGAIWYGVFLYLGPGEVFWKLALFPLWAGVTTGTLWLIDWGLMKLSDVYLDWRRGRDATRGNSTDSRDARP
jgi:hypothetical protein